jgi:hypothetical protein
MVVASHNNLLCLCPLLRFSLPLRVVSRYARCRLVVSAHGTCELSLLRSHCYALMLPKDSYKVWVQCERSFLASFERKPLCSGDEQDEVSLSESESRSIYILGPLVLRI